MKWNKQHKVSKQSKHGTYIFQHTPSDFDLSQKLQLWDEKQIDRKESNIVKLSYPIRQSSQIQLVQEFNMLLG